MKLIVPLLLAAAAIAAGQSTGQPTTGQPAGPPAAKAESKPDVKVYTVPMGTKLPLQLISSVSTKTAAVGDKVYLQTNFPFGSEGKILVPAGTYVSATVTSVKRAGKVKGKAELYIRFDSLTLPNGITRDFRATVSSLDGSNPGRVDRAEGKIEGDGGKGSDAVKVGEAAAWGTMIGGVAARSSMGAGIGAAAGAAAGLAGILLTRGPDAILERGSTVEMVLDRTLTFTDLDVAGFTAGAPAQVVAPRAPEQSRSRFPL